MSETIECIFCGLPCDPWEIDGHLKECRDGIAVSHYIGEDRMQLNERILTQGAVSTHQFIKTRNIMGKEATVKIVAFREADASMQFSDYLLDVKLGKNTFTYGLRERGEDMIALAKAFGLDTDKWIAKDVVLYKEKYTSANNKVSEILRCRPVKK